MVMPRSRSRSIESSTCASISRSDKPPHNWMMRSARVDLPWSMWAMMEKLRMLFINRYKKRIETTAGTGRTLRSVQPARNTKKALRAGRDALASAFDTTGSTQNSSFSTPAFYRISEWKARLMTCAAWESVFLSIFLEQNDGELCRNCRLIKHFRHPALAAHAACRGNMTQLGLLQAGVQHRHQLIETGHQRRVGVDIDDLDGEGTFGRPQLFQCVQHVLAEMAITT